MQRTCTTGSCTAPPVGRQSMRRDSRCCSSGIWLSSASPLRPRSRESRPPCSCSCAAHSNHSFKPLGTCRREGRQLVKRSSRCCSSGIWCVQSLAAQAAEPRVRPHCSCSDMHLDPFIPFFTFVRSNPCSRMHLDPLIPFFTIPHTHPRRLPGTTAALAAYRQPENWPSTTQSYVIGNRGRTATLAERRKEGSKPATQPKQRRSARSQTSQMPRDGPRLVPPALRDHSQLLIQVLAVRAHELAELKPALDVGRVDEVVHAEQAPAAAPAARQRSGARLRKVQQLQRRSTALRNGLGFPGQCLPLATPHARRQQIHQL